MSNISILNLPVELLHRIFDDLDAYVIIHSVRRVCKQFYEMVNSYNRLHVNLDPDPDFRWRLKAICGFIQSQLSNIRSLTLHPDYYSYGKRSKFFLANCDIDDFTNLHSLTLHMIKDMEMNESFQHIMQKSLVSLKIRIAGEMNVAVCSIIFSMIIQCKIQKLDLSGIDYATNEVTWPVQNMLIQLEIRDCTFHQYCTILAHSPHLRRFTLSDCSMKSHDQTSSQSSSRTSRSAKRQRISSTDFTATEN